MFLFVAPTAFADSDLAGSLGNADEHDVHHANAADHQADRRNSDHEQKESAGQ